MTYSRRKRIRDSAGEAPPLRSMPFGTKLLTQLFQLFAQMDGTFKRDDSLFPRLVGYLRSELGVIALGSSRATPDEFFSWWISEYPDQSLHDLRVDVVELACSLTLIRGEHLDLQSRVKSTSNRRLAQQLVDMVNGRMMEDGFGFQFKDDQIIEVTSEFAFEEIIVPALGILSDPIFEAANVEFRDAFEEFKQRKYDDCIADCGNAFESVMKVIAAQKGWKDVSENDPASKLIEALYRHQLIPTWMGEQLNGLKSMLQGVATVRNKEASHGAGEERREVSKHLAAYQLHQTAAAIIFLVEQAGL